MNLLKKKCVPCEVGGSPMTKGETIDMMAEVPGWSLTDDFKIIFKEYKFKDFIGAINFVERVADVAEMEGHHPDIHIFYNKVTLELSTHAINGLSENDFIVAAKIDQIK